MALVCFWPQKSSKWDYFWPKILSIWPREPLWVFILNKEHTLVMLCILLNFAFGHTLNLVTLCMWSNSPVSQTLYFVTLFFIQICICSHCGFSHTLHLFIVIFFWLITLGHIRTKLMKHYCSSTRYEFKSLMLEIFWFIMMNQKF